MDVFQKRRRGCCISEEEEEEEKEVRYESKTNVMEQFYYAELTVFDI